MKKFKNSQAKIVEINQFKALFCSKPIKSLDNLTQNYIMIFQKPVKPEFEKN